MTSLLLIASLFLFWSFLGRTVVAFFNPSFGSLRSCLIAPAVGLSVMVVILMVVNQAGLSLGLAALPVTLIVFLLGIYLWWKSKPDVPFKALLPFIGILTVSSLCMGWPALKQHFNWISFVTDDYVNYCLAADRFKSFGFYRLPKVDELTGLDYAQYFWFMHVPAQVRFGAEHQISWLSALTGLRSLQVFMPIILALGLVQIASISALVLQKGRYRKHAIVTGLFLAFSPMFVFSTVYQLIAQVGGLGLMLTSVTLLTAALRGRSRIKLLKASVPIAFVSAALAVFYPEVSPFAALTVLLYFFYDWYKTKQFPGARVVLLEYVLAMFFLLLRSNVISYIYSLSTQLAGGLKKTDLSLSLFPFFLIPSGVASLFGLQPMNADLSEPWGSFVIIAGGVLLVAVVLHCLTKFKHAQPYLVLLAVQGALAVSLFRSGNDFGTYKIAMFIQPVLMAALAAVFIGIRKRWVAVVFIVGLFGCMLNVDFGFMQSSMGKSGTIVAEVENVSAALVNPPKGPSPHEHWISSIDNIVAAKIAAHMYRGGSLEFPTRDMFPITDLIQSDWPFIQWLPQKNVYPLAKEFIDNKYHKFVTENSIFGTQFYEAKQVQAATGYLSLTNSRNLFNKLHADDKTNDDFFVVKPVSSAENLIIFIHSTLGNHYYLGDRSAISFYQQEDDYYASSSKINGMGRFFLFRIDRPTPQVYLRLAATKTLMAVDNKTWSHNALIKGADEVAIPFAGSGAANLFVGPITPVKLGEHYYIALDMGEIPRPFPSNRSGFKALYNRNVPLDYRLLTSYGRDISVISVADYQALARPTRLEKFPEDIIHARELEFSGIYEDGWLSPDSTYVLGESHPGDAVRLRLQIPSRAFSTNSVGEARISVNKGNAVVIAVTANDFDWLLPIQNPGKKTELSVSFSMHGVLKYPDSRVVSAKLDYIKLLSISKVDFTAATGPRPPTNGIDLDGWCESKAAFDMPISEQSNGVVLNINYPGWWNAPLTSSVSISLDNDQPHVYKLKQGINTITVPAAPGVCKRRVNLQSNLLLSLPKPDNRERAFCLLSAESNDQRYWKTELQSSAYVLGAKVNYAQEGAKRPPTQGVKSDGWTEKEVSISLPVSRNSTELTFEIFYPGWPNVPRVNHLKISIDGDKPQEYDIMSGPNLIHIHEPVGFSSHTINIIADASFIMPGANDNRECAYRLVSLQSN